LGKETREQCAFVIGCGRWGSFLSWYLDQIGHRVSLYGREDSRRFRQLRETRKNEEITLPPSVNLTTELERCLEADVLLISINSQNLAALAEKLALLGIREKRIVLCMKGLEWESGKRLSQVVSDVLDHSNRIGVWLGPGHVQELSRGIPSCMVIDSNDEILKDELIRMFSSDLIRFYYGTDLVGNEIGAAAKNVIGIAAGMLEGLNYPSLKGALMARGAGEISRLIVAMGGNEKSAYGLCHLGDYQATLFSPHSQNLNFGKHFVEGLSYDKLAEGYYTVKALYHLGRAYGVELPICDAVYRILYEKQKPTGMLRLLFSRSLKTEF